MALNEQYLYFQCRIKNVLSDATNYQAHQVNLPLTITVEYLVISTTKEQTPDTVKLFSELIYFTPEFKITNWLKIVTRIEAVKLNA